MRNKHSATKPARAIAILYSVMICILVFNVAFLCIMGRTLVSSDDIRKFSHDRNDGQKTNIDRATRGTIYTSDGTIAAQDIIKYKIRAIIGKTYVDSNKNPLYVVNKERTAEILCEYLEDLDYETVLARLNKNGYQVEFGSGGRNISAVKKTEIETALAAENLKGIEFIKTIARNYPLGDFASYAIGYAALNEEEDANKMIGMMGIEQSYNDYLSGVNGEKTYLVDSAGNELPNGVISETTAYPGCDVYLTINESLQKELDSLFTKLIEKSKSTKGSCAIMDTQTGELLALSNYPSFDPNNRSSIVSYNDVFFYEAYEPGSVIKPFVYGNALTDKVLRLTDTFDSGEYEVKINGKYVATIHDHNEGKGWGTITYAEGLYNSSNVAICNILADKVNINSLIDTYESLGLFQTTSVDGLLSSAGICGFNRKNATKSLEYYTTGFGQGSTLTAFQLLRGYSAFANDGRMVEPYLVKKVVDPTTSKVVYQGETKKSKKIFSSAAVTQLKNLLYGVTNRQGYTGYRYHRDDFEIIGKTGTGQVAVDGKYSDTINSHTFAGLAPYSDPRIAIVVWYENATGVHETCFDLVKQILKDAYTSLYGNSKRVQSETYELSSYINQSVTYAKRILSSHGMDIITLGDGKSVIKQYPGAQTTVYSGTKVMLLTDGTKIKMPDMTDWSRKDAEAFAELAGINIEVEGVGTIYKQSIEKKAILHKGDTIKVYAK